METNKYIYNFIINNKSIEYTEPIEELVRERNTTVKYGEKNNFPYFWCYSVENFLNIQGNKKKLEDIFSNQKLKFKDLDKNFIIVSTSDINLRDWLKIKLPDFLDLNKTLLHGENSLNSYITNYNGFINTLVYKENYEKNVDMINNLYEEIYGKKL